MLPEVAQPLSVMLHNKQLVIQQLHELSSCTGQEASSCLSADIYSAVQDFIKVLIPLGTVVVACWY